MIALIVFAVLGYSSHAPAAVEDKTQQAIEKFVRDYIATAGKRAAAKSEMSVEFVSYAKADAEAFAACAKQPCEVTFRRPVEVMDWKDPAATKSTRFSFEIEVLQNGQALAERPGCYVVEKRGEKLLMDIYISECNED